MASKGWALLPLIFLFLSPLLIESRSPPSEHHHHSQPFEFIQKLEGCHKGEAIKGLHKLKQYLEKFGYLPHHYYTTTANSTVGKNGVRDGEDDDNFDDLLESAIKTYQLNYHLNVTGELDAATAQQMMMPRCGVPDVINGKSSMRAGDGKGRNLREDFHAVAHFTFFPNAPRWPPSKSQLTYAFESVSPAVGRERLRSITASAFSKWAQVSHFTFQETQNVRSADIRIGFFARGHGDNAPFDGNGGVLAHAFAPTRGLFHFDAEENWQINPSSPNAFDVESVAVHEIGHLLGLGHSDDRSAIMFPTINAGQRKVDLGQDDINGIRALYGGQNN